MPSLYAQDDSGFNAELPTKFRHVRYELNTDFDASRLDAKDLTALVAAWQQGAISRDTLMHNLRVGEVLPPARTNEQEEQLIGKKPPWEARRQQAEDRGLETGARLGA